MSVLKTQHPVDRSYSLFRRIQSIRRSAEELRDSWLTENGWEHTCQTPGSYWMWRKGEFFCDTATAERIQSNLTAAACFDLHPEEESDW